MEYDLFGYKIITNIKRKYYPYVIWEDYLNGMYRKISCEDEKMFLKKAIWFTGKHKLYGNWMRKIINKWPISCEQNLTNNDQNKKAWIGHAACCLAFKCPEYITRQAWGFLTIEQQILANKEAENAIELWRISYAKNL